MAVVSAWLVAACGEPSLARAESQQAQLRTLQIAKARQLYFDGGRLRELGKLEAALGKFSAAHAIMRVPTTGVEVGRTLFALKRFVEAADAFLEVIRMPRSEDESASFASARNEARSLAMKAERRVARLQFQGVSPPTAGVEVQVDGAAVADLSEDKPLRLDPGLHVVILRSSGGKLREHRMVLDAGKVSVLDVRSAARGPLADAQEAPKAWPPPLALTMLGVGAAGLLAGGVVGGIALSRSAELERACVSGACPPQEHDALDGLRRLSHASTGLLVAGGVLGVAGGLWWTVAAVKRGGSQGSSALSAPLKVRVGLAGLDVRMRF